MKEFIVIIGNNGNKKLTEDQIIERLKPLGLLNLKSTVLLATGTTPLSVATREGYLKVVKYLIEQKKADPCEIINSKEIKGSKFTALEVALQRMHQEIALYLISKMNGNFQVPSPLDTKGNVAIEIAIMEDNIEVLKAMLAAKPTLLKCQTTIGSLLHIAATNGAVKITEYLSENGEDGKPRCAINGVNNQGSQTPLDLALGFLQSNVVKILLKKGAIVNCFHHADHNVFSSIEENINNPEDKRKAVACVNALLAAGYGIDKAQIKDHIFPYLNISQNMRGQLPFLLVAYCKGTSKLITTVNQMRNFLSNPDWRFETELIARKVNSPQLQNNEYAKQIKALLPANFSVDSANEQEDEVDLAPLSMDKIKACNDFDFALLLIEYYSDYHRKQTRLKEFLKSRCTDDFREKSLEDYGQACKNMIDFFGDKRFFNEMYPSDHILHTIEHDLCEFSLNYINIMRLRNVNGYAMYNIINDILASKAKILSGNTTNNFLTNLRSTNINSGINLAIIHFKAKEYIQACAVGRKVYYQLINFKKSQSIAAHVFEDKVTADQFNLLMLLTISYFKQDNYEQSRNFLLRALQIDALKLFALNDNWPVDYHLSKSIDILSEQYSLESTIALNALIQFINDCPMSNGKNSVIQKLDFHIESYFEKNCMSIDPDQQNRCGEDKYIRVKIEEYTKRCTEERTIYLNGTLKDIGSIAFNEETKAVVLTVNPCHLKALSTLPVFGDIVIEEDKIIFNRNFLLSLEFEIKLAKMHKYLIPSVTLSSIEALNKQLEALQLETTNMQKGKRKEKAKTRGKANPDKVASVSSVAAIENHGFTFLPGYSAAVPIVNYPGNHYLTMPVEEDPSFKPFLPLIADGFIRSIPPKGKNQQGAKIKGDFVRLKISGQNHKNLRATGEIQEVLGEGNQMKKLFVVNEITCKKSEKRKGYGRN